MISSRNPNATSEDQCINVLKMMGFDPAQNAAFCVGKVRKVLRTLDTVDAEDERVLP